jgi:endonuclease YncB( thermonuclease family)
MPGRLIRHLGLALALVLSPARAEPIAPALVEIVDGDTIRIQGETFRLVGFDTPETFRAMPQIILYERSGAGVGRS